MQLVASVSIPKNDGELSITPEKLKKFREKGFPIEWYVLLAIQLSYSHKNPSILPSEFCEEWGILEHELDAAMPSAVREATIAKLQKKGLLYRPSPTIQLELFDLEQQEQE